MAGEKILDFALAYRNILGLSVIPVKYKDKIPIAKWREYTTRLPTEAELREWFDREEKLNIAAVCGKVSGNLVVLDFDDESVFEKIFTKGKELIQETLTVKTPRGLHVYLRTKNPVPSRRYDEIKLDIKGEGSIVNLPPSVHPSGVEYKFYGGGRFAIMEIEEDIFSLIETQLDKFKIRYARASEKVDETELKNIMETGVEEGRRYTWRSNIYFYLRKNRYSEDEIRKKIYEFNDKCKPPESPTEIERQLKWLFKHFPPINVESIYNEDGKIIPAKVAELFIKEKNGYVKTTTGKNKEILVFNGMVWKNGEDELLSFIKTLVGEAYNRRLRDEVIANVEALTVDLNYELKEPPPKLIPLVNGVYDIEAEILREYEPDMFFREENIIPVKYNPDAKCPEIDKFLDEVVTKENRVILEEFIGYCLYRDYSLQKALVLVGEGSNGKSTFLEMLTHFLGKKNVIGRTLQELENNRFAAANLHRKLVNIFADLPYKRLKSASIFKSLTGGDYITTEKKYGREPVSFVNYAKLVFSANMLPEIYEDTDAFFRRFIIIPFPNKFEGDKADPDKLKKITTDEEMSGLLNIALKRLKEILNRGSFSYSKTSEEIRREYMRQSHPVSYFVTERIAPDPENFVITEELYRAYIDFAFENNLPRMSENAFMRKFLQACRYKVAQEYRKVDGIRKKGYTGIRITTEKKQENE
jgi:putative DNA primase/helicase